MSLTQPAPPVRPRRRPSKPLTELAERFGDERSVLGPSPADVTIHGITLTSGTVEKGDVFVALTGRTQHGAAFAADAKAAGAVAILTDPAGAEQSATTGLPVVVHDELRAALGRVAAWLFDTDASPVKLFAVTGTNGKTSVTHILEAVLSQAGVTTGLSSTAERHVDGEVFRSGLTTPETVDLHSLIARWTEGATEAAAVEVSAQSIERHRIDGVVFDVAGFTNLTHDHLDDYGDMATYLEAKRPLFRPEHARLGVIDIDTPAGASIAASAPIPVQTISSDPAAVADWHVTVTAESIKGVSFTLHRTADGWSVSTSLSIIGAVMAKNAGLAIAMASLAGYSDEVLANAVQGGIEVYIPGRAERVSGDTGPTFLVDFGHSEDAFVRTLDAARAVTPAGGRVIALFGADGDRDKLKRVPMSAAVVDHSDLVIVTDHHPRFEDAAAIRATLRDAARQRAAETKPGFEVLEISPPEVAIRKAIELAGDNDTIMWFGPGHQHHRDIKGVRTPYGGVDEARAALREAGYAPNTD